MSFSPTFVVNEFMGLNMSWKKKFVCEILAKKLFVFDQGEKKVIHFVVRKKKRLVGKKNHTPPPTLVLNGPPLNIS